MGQTGVNIPDSKYYGNQTKLLLRGFRRVRGTACAAYCRSLEIVSTFDLVTL